jgi:hypothetical protein
MASSDGAGDTLRDTFPSDAASPSGGACTGAGFFMSATGSSGTVGVSEGVGEGVLRSMMTTGRGWVSASDPSAAWLIAAGLSAARSAMAAGRIAPGSRGVGGALRERKKFSPLSESGLRMGVGPLVT